MKCNLTWPHLLMHSVPSVGRSQHCCTQLAQPNLRHCPLFDMSDSNEGSLSSSSSSATSSSAPPSSIVGGLLSYFGWEERRFHSRGINHFCVTVRPCFTSSTHGPGPFKHRILRLSRLLSNPIHPDESSKSDMNDLDDIMHPQMLSPFICRFCLYAYSDLFRVPRARPGIKWTLTTHSIILIHWVALLLLDVICGYMILNHLSVHSSHHAQVRKEVMFALLRDDNKKRRN